MKAITKKVLDWTQSQLPKGIQIVVSQIHGWGLATTRNFTQGETVFQFKSDLRSWNERIHVQTDLGTKELSMATHCAGEVTLKLLASLPKPIQKKLATHVGLYADDLKTLWQTITHDGQYCAIFNNQGAALMNHADKPNTTDIFERWEPGRNLIGWSRQIALRDICAGEELTCDYNAYAPDFRSSAH